MTAAENYSAEGLVDAPAVIESHRDRTKLRAATAPPRTFVVPL
jgi:hypothetical protein